MSDSIVLPYNLKIESGAVGDGETDDYSVLQSSIDFCIANDIRSLYLPSGNYAISKGLVFSNQDDSFLVGMTIFGDGAGYDNVSGQTVITCLTGNDFGINLQRVKGFRLHNIVVEGQNTGVNNYSVGDICSNDQSITFVTNGVRDNQYSPHAGIVVDGFRDTEISIPNRYQAYIDKYINSANGGSTDIEILNCRTRYFVVGILLSPSSQPQNGEIIKIQNCWSDNVKSAIAVGEAQARSILIENFHCWSAMTIFDCLNYGDGAGCPPKVIGLNAAGAIRYLCQLNTWISEGLQISKSHIESLWSLGGNSDPTSGILSIDDSWIEFIGSLDNTIYGKAITQPYTVFKGGSLKVTNSYLWQYGSQYQLPLNISCPYVIFDKVIFDKIPIVNGSVQFINCQSYRGNFGNNFVIGTGGSAASMQAYNGVFMGDMKCFYSGGRIRRRINNIQNSYSGVVQAFFNGPITVISTDPNLLKTTLQFNPGSVDYKNIIIGDVIYAFLIDEYGKNIVTPLGSVISKTDSNGNVVVGGRSIPVGIYAGGIYRNEIFIGVLILGDITTGSNTITNVQIEANGVFSLTNIPIYLPHFPLGTVITAVVGNTIILNQQATISETNVAIISSNWKCEEQGTINISNPSKLGYKKGDIIWNNRGDLHPDITYWMCNKNGITGTLNPPTFTNYV